MGGNGSISELSAGDSHKTAMGAKFMRKDRDTLLAEACQQLFGVAPAVIREAREATQGDGESSIVDVLVAKGALDAYEQDILRQLTDKLYDPEARTLLAESLAAGESVALDLEFLQLQEEERYLSLQEHDRGGMGRIVTVWDRRMNREVARKELLSRHTESGSGNGSSDGKRRRVMGRFLREAQVTGRLQHPSIVPVYEIGRRDDGTVYYTMKFVRGRTLERAIQAAGDIAGRLELLPHIIDLCQAVAYAHSQGVIHRDLKPANVMIGEFGETYLIDWGLAKFMGRDEAVEGDGDGTAEEEDGDLDNLTAEGEVMGTPHYMPPEQAAGKLRELDERSDIYALGAVLYHLLTGERPFDGLSRMRVLSQVLQAEPLAPDKVEPDVPPALAAICRRAMEIDPAQRYSTARELAAEVQRYESGGRVAAHDYGRVELMRRFLTRHRPVVATAVLGLFVLMVVVVYAFLALNERADAEREARVEAERAVYAMGLNIAQQEMRERDYSSMAQSLYSSEDGRKGWEWGHLYFQISAQRDYSFEHEIAFEDVEVTRDGTHLATADYTGCAAIWNIEARRAEQTFHLHDTNVLDIALHPDGNVLASSSLGGEIAVHDIGSGDTVAAWYLPGGVARELTFSPDGSYLLAAGAKSVSVWHWMTQTRHGDLHGDGAEMYAVRFSPDGTFLAGGDAAGMVYVWNWGTGQRVFNQMGHATGHRGAYSGTLSVAFRPGTNSLASSGADTRIVIWDWRTGMMIRELREFRTKVWCVDYAPDGSTLLAVSAGGAPRLWDAQRDYDFLRNIGSQAAASARYSIDGSEVYRTGGNGRVETWYMEDGHRPIYLESDDGEPADLSFHPSGQKLLAVTEEGGLYSWPIASFAHVPRRGIHTHLCDVARVRMRQSVTARQLGLAAPGGSSAIAVHPEGRLVSISTGGGRIEHRDVNSGSVLGAFRIPDYPDGIRVLAYHPDGRTLFASGYGDEFGRDAVLLDAETGSVRWRLSGHTREITHLSFTADGRYAATGSRDSNIRIWNVENGKLANILKDAHGRHAVEFVFDPTGHYIARSNSDNVTIQSTEVGSDFHREFYGAWGDILSVAFNPDGTRLVAVTSEETVLWDRTSGVKLVTLPVGGTKVRFSPDGSVLATLGMDRRIALWHALPWK